MRFDIISIFPRIFDSYFKESIIKRAREKRLVQIKVHNLRDFVGVKNKKVALRQTQGDPEPRRRIDDKPYGGGAGMVLMAEPILKAVHKLISSKSASSRKLKNLTTSKLPEAESRTRINSLRGKQARYGAGKTKIVLLSAKGKQFNQKMAYNWAQECRELILISGRYEGIDERVKQILKADLSTKLLSPTRQSRYGDGAVSVEEISIGPYVLTDGDVAAMTIISAVTRLIPGVINWESLEEESYFNRLIEKGKNKGELEYPHYTRPEVLKWKNKKYKVPKVLLSGDHKRIAEWRKNKRIKKSG